MFGIKKFAIVAASAFAVAVVGFTGIGQSVANAAVLTLEEISIIVSDNTTEIVQLNLWAEEQDSNIAMVTNQVAALRTLTPEDLQDLKNLRHALKTNPVPQLGEVMGGLTLMDDLYTPEPDYTGMTQDEKIDYLLARTQHQAMIIVLLAKNSDELITYGLDINDNLRQNRWADQLDTRLTLNDKPLDY